MGLFDKIKEKLGIGGTSNEAHKPVDPTTTPNQHATDSQRPTAAHNATTTPSGSAPLTGTTDANVSAVDVPAKLDGMAAAHSQQLNWRTSIVDLLKLLGLDSSLEARKQLATELGCPQEKMGDSAAMNIWLHKAVMHQLAEHGGTVPPELRI
ncbi:MAG: DUF3597 domain-containing protein [Pseudomonas sp.]